MEAKVGHDPTPTDYETARLPIILFRQMAPDEGIDPPWTLTQPRVSSAVPYLSANPACGAV